MREKGRKCRHKWERVGPQRDECKYCGNVRITKIWDTFYHELQTREFYRREGEELQMYKSVNTWRSKGRTTV